MENKRTTEHTQFFSNNESDVESERIIYTPSDFAKTALFYLQEAGVLQAKRQHTASRENLNSYLFFIVEEGEGALEYGGEHYDLKKNDCIFINCKNSYAHMTGEKLWKLRWVHFYGSNMKAVYERYLDRGGRPCFSTNKGQRYQELLKEIYDVAASTSYVRDMKINEKLSGLLVLLMEDSWHAGEEGGVGKAMAVQEVKEYLDENFVEKITLDELSEKFYINKFYLLEVFKQQYGMGVNEYLIYMRITKGKRLLRFTDKTVEEIAYDCGMNSLHYFSRLFKKIEGVTPSEYRRRWTK